MTSSDDWQRAWETGANRPWALADKLAINALVVALADGFARDGSSRVA